MSKYATEQKFGGQRASVGRVVVLATDRHDDKSGMCLRAGVILAISSSKDIPYIAAHASLKTTVGHILPGDHEWKFVETRTETEVEAMPIGSWTWPPRI